MDLKISTKKIILLVNDKKIFSECEKIKITKTLCAQQDTKI